MFGKYIISIVLTTILVAASSVYAIGANNNVKVTIPSFPVTLNELKFNNNNYEQYPLLVYRDITYFPMTYYQSNLLNLNTSWTAEGGLTISKGNPETPKVYMEGGLVTNENGVPKMPEVFSPISKQNGRTQTAAIIDSKVTVNGKVIDNGNEPYPLLLFRDITYFPLTWRFAVEEFGWSYTFENIAGLNIRANNLFYTANGDSYRDDNGTWHSVVNETHYIKGALHIYLQTELARLLGPVSGGLHIIKDGVEMRPLAPDSELTFFGYYQKNGPLFTIDGNYINTVYYTDPDMRNTRPCKVNIETGSILAQ